MPACCRRTHPVALPSVSGYTGGGRQMIEAYEAGGAPPYELYALGLKHKHIPEIMHCYGRVTRRPIFVPVGNFDQGMLVELPLHLALLPGQPSAARLLEAYRAHYDGADAVSVEDAPESGKLDAVALKDTNQLEIRVFANPEARRRCAWRAWTTWARAPVGRQCRT
jgi:N-acetyl-gamma-glutamyl-phosphate reductase